MLWKRMKNALWKSLKKFKEGFNEAVSLGWVFKTCDLLGRRSILYIGVTAFGGGGGGGKRW